MSSEQRIGGLEACFARMVGLSQEGVQCEVAGADRGKGEVHS